MSTTPETRPLFVLLLLLPPEPGERRVKGAVLRVVALPAVLLAFAPFHSSIKPLPQPVRAQLKTGGFWQRACRVPLPGLRLLRVSYRDFDGRVHMGQLVVNKSAARPLVGVFRQPYRLRFPIRHLRLADMYGPSRSRPRDGDVSGSFH